MHTETYFLNKPLEPLIPNHSLKECNTGVLISLVKEVAKISENLL